MKRYTREDVDKMSRATFLKTTFQKTMGWLERPSKEWTAAWRGLARMSGDKDFVGEHEGEAWQYMGSDSWLGYWSHHFRHRNHRKLGLYARIRVPASPGWAPTPRHDPEEETPRKPKRRAKRRPTAARAPDLAMPQ